MFLAPARVARLPETNRRSSESPLGAVRDRGDERFLEEIVARGVPRGVLEATAPTAAATFFTRTGFVHREASPLVFVLVRGTLKKAVESVPPLGSTKKQSDAD